MIRRLRLLTGLTLFTYVATHAIALVAGNYSLAAMEGLRHIVSEAWETWLGLFLLYGAFLTHLSLGLYAIYRRRRWRGMARSEALQLITGLSVPVLLALHFVSTRMAEVLYDLEPTYPWIMAIYLKYDTVAGVRQALTLLTVWLHGCLGLYFWLRLKPFWPRWRFVLFAGALLWPTLSLTGFWKAGNEAVANAADPAWVRAVLTEVGVLNNDAQSMLLNVENIVILILAGLLTATLVARSVRLQWEKRRGMVRLRYDDGREFVFNQGFSLLEASRECNHPHAGVCGGRGRCSTCRVRVRKGAELLPPPSPAEVAVLERVRAGPDVRLACQSIPAAGSIDITPLLPHTATARHGHAAANRLSHGREATIAVMFCDLRGFTRVSEDRLPYDTVFLLNRYFDAMGRAIEESGGHLDKFIGDGVMALFGLEDGAEAGCRNALRAAKRMAERLAALNSGLRQDLDQPLRIGIGIHVGPTIVGEMGYGRATQITAIGDTVNTASRLESMTKEFSAQLVVSRAVLETAGQQDFMSEAITEHEAAIRGRQRPLRVVAVADATALPV